jgi:hypothetical protein
MSDRSYLFGQLIMFEPGVLEHNRFFASIRKHIPFQRLMISLLASIL